MARPKSTGLTLTEQRVCDLMAEGLCNKLIGRELGISPRTVEDHRSGIYRKMGVSTAIALVCKVYKRRIAELEAANGAN